MAEWLLYAHRLTLTGPVINKEDICRRSLSGYSLSPYREAVDHVKCPKKNNNLTSLTLTLGEGGVRGTASFPEADGGAVVRLPVLGSQGSHSWVGRPSA